MLQIARDRVDDEDGAVYVIGDNLIRHEDSAGWRPDSCEKNCMTLPMNHEAVIGLGLVPGERPRNVRLEVKE